jgi:hypothetical protein
MISGVRSVAENPLPENPLPEKEHPMSVLHLLAAAPAAVGAHTVTSGRLVATAAALTALAGAVVGGLALARATARPDSGSGRRRAVVAVLAGLCGLVVGGWVVLTADGGPGTGNGIVGGFAALAAGLIATILGGLALSRSGRTA